MGKDSGKGAVKAKEARKVGAGGLVTVDQEEVRGRQGRVTEWLRRHCVYCEVTGAPESNKCARQKIDHDTTVIMPIVLSDLVSC